MPDYDDDYSNRYYQDEPDLDQIIKELELPLWDELDVDLDELEYVWDDEEWF